MTKIISYMTILIVLAFSALAQDSTYMDTSGSMEMESVTEMVQPDEMMAEESETETAAEEAEAAPTIDSGDTTWILVSAALVMLMTPGLAFFYAGMVSRKNVVSTLLQNFSSLGVVGLLWVVVGYSLAFSEGNKFIGGLDFFMLEGQSSEISGSIPMYAFIAFQMMFAVIAPAIMTGSIAERVHFKGWMILMGLWSLFVYAPVCHWVWGTNGFIAGHGGLDFAGGLVVHLTAGVGGLVGALMYGKRTNSEHNLPNDVSMIMLGAALLWFGWFGFNAGSALAAGTLAAHAFMTTFVGAAAAFLGWLLTDWAKDERPSAVGGAIGLVVGLVIITPAAGFVSVQSAIIMCALGSIICNLFARFIKKKAHLDDTLDVFACHGVGGALGAILTGLFASTEVNEAGVDGLLMGGDMSLFNANLLGVVIVAVYTAIVTFVLIKLVSFITPIRVSKEDETKGLDTAIHGEISRYHDRDGHGTSAS